MSIIALVGGYIARHARNLESDTIAHLKAFAAHAEATLSSAADTVKEDVKDAASYIKEKAESVESTVEEVAAHAKDSFIHLLQAQADTSTESAEK